MKKSIIFLVTILMVAFTAMANPVDREKARKVGNAYLNAMEHRIIGMLEEVKTPFSEFYVFNAVEAGSGIRSGFVLVAADDCVRPILGYSLTNVFPEGDIPANVRGWLKDIENGIGKVKAERLKRKSSSVPSLLSDEVVAQEWQRLAAGTAPEPAVLTSVNPLLTTTWNQSPLYNDLCPYDSIYGQHVVTGCVATATAQIMKYWNHPATGYGSHSYHASNNHADYGWLTADFGTTNYAWSTMPNALTSASSAAEINAVATLMYHVGVAVEMGYNVSSQGGSGSRNHSDFAPSAKGALVNYFKYSPDIVVLPPNVDNYDAYCTTLRAELDQSRPILYQGHSPSGGHSFVCDGYDQYDNFHFNWGWGGAYDGYYAIGALNPGSYTFNISTAAMLNIRPNANFGTGGMVAVSTSGGDSTCTAAGAGTYAFGDTVTLFATAGEGYRFAGWSDNSQDNPRIFTMTGGNYSFTARFETLGGDTLSYCGNKGLYTSWGEYEEGFDKYWGIKLPASSLTPGHTLKAVELFIEDFYNGDYDLTVYSGTTAPTDTIYSTTEWVDYDDRNDWFSFFLSTPYTVEAGKSIWITFHNNDITFPATVCTSCGNPDGFLYGPAFNPDPEWNLYTFMIRGRFDTPVAVAHGDTLSYCVNKPYFTSMSAEEWGIMIPSAELAGRNYLKSVKLFVDYTGIYTLNVYKGGNNAPGILVHTQPADITSRGWQEIVLDGIVAINAPDSLWITFSCPDLRWPAAFCRYTGSPNSNWVNWGSSIWEHLSFEWGSFSWMIKAVTSDTTPILPPPTVAIRGGNYAGISSPTTFTATHTTGTVVTWNIVDGTPTTATGDTVAVTWSTTGWYQISASVSNSHGTGTDNWWVNVVDCDQPITSYPYRLGFEATENMVCVDTLDYDNDGYGWNFSDDRHTGQRAFASNGMIWNGSAWVQAAADDWLFLPKMATHQNAGYSIQWYEMTSYDEDEVDNPHYGVFIDTTCSSNPANYMLVAEFNNVDDAGEWYLLRSLDLSAYAGKTFRLAFRHYNAGINTIFIDDITVNESVPLFREDDTISYCGWRNVRSNLGYSGTTYWGVKFTSSQLAGCDTLKSVLLYVSHDGSYTLNITQEGTDAPGTFIRSVDTMFIGQYGWKEFMLNPAIPLNNMQPLWITFVSTASYPAVYTQFCGDYNSDWISGNGVNWQHATDYDFDASWMIKAVIVATGCDTITLPYTADFSQCWTAENGATIIDNNHAQVCSQGEQITSPWINTVPGKVFLTWTTSRDCQTWDESDPRDIQIVFYAENAGGDIIASGSAMPAYMDSIQRFSFDSPGGPMRLLIGYNNYIDGTPVSSLQLSNLALFQYQIEATLEVPDVIRKGVPTTIVTHIATPDGMSADHTSLGVVFDNRYHNVLDELNDNDPVALISHTDSTYTLVWQDTGSYRLELYTVKYDVYGQHMAFASDEQTINVIIDAEGIEDIEADKPVLIFVLHGAVVVEGVADETVSIYDVMGRVVGSELLAVGNRQSTRVFEVPMVGVYMVRVGDRPAHKVVVIK